MQTNAIQRACSTL